MDSLVPNPKLLKFQAYEILKKAIICGILHDDDMITERRAWEEFQISRTPFREAIQTLSAEGWVYSVPYKGTYVSPVTRKMIDDVFQLRLILESYIIKEISRNVDKRTIQALEDTIAGMKIDPAEQDDYEFSLLDLVFHKRIYEQANNHLIMTVCEQISDLVLRITMRVIPHHSRRSEVIQEHKEIIAGLKNGEAGKALEHHLLETKRHAITNLNL